MTDLILVDPSDPGDPGDAGTGIVSVTLNRPDRRNALSIDLLEELSATLHRLAEERANRVVILRGAGPVFSSGLDLREAADSSLIERSASALGGALDLLRETPLVVIAAVQGGAFAGGAGIMAACDIVVAADNAKIGFPEARRGLLPALICGVLRHRVREGDLRDLFLAGDSIGTARAQQMGLVQRIVPPERLFDEATAVARSIVAGGPETIRRTKQLLNVTFHSDSKHGTPDLIQTHLAARQRDEAREGLAAFIQKRAPKWTDGDAPARKNLEGPERPESPETGRVS